MKKYIVSIGLLVIFRDGCYIENRWELFYNRKN